jgi:hypothetical protein
MSSILQQQQPVRVELIVGVLHFLALVWVQSRSTVHAYKKDLSMCGTRELESVTERHILVSLQGIPHRYNVDTLRSPEWWSCTYTMSEDNAQVAHAQ